MKYCIQACEYGMIRQCIFSLSYQCDNYSNSTP